MEGQISGRGVNRNCTLEMEMQISSGNGERRLLAVGVWEMFHARDFKVLLS
jgi:hypothetical protein